MKKVKKAGVPPPPTEYIGTCTHCGCKFECDDSDLNTVRNIDWNWYGYTEAYTKVNRTSCPTCNKPVDVHVK